MTAHAISKKSRVTQGSPRAVKTAGRQHKAVNSILGHQRIQTKSSHSNDEYEIQAERAARQVVLGEVAGPDSPTAGVQLSLLPNQPVPLTDEHDENNQRSVLLQDLAESTGTRLPARELTFFNHRFGHDFSAVKIHAGNRADALCSQLGAQAFTFGHSIYFRAGHFAPATIAGRLLLAHELAHVVQQGRAAAIQPRLDPAGDTAQNPDELLQRDETDEELQEEEFSNQQEANTQQPLTETMPGSSDSQQQRVYTALEALPHLGEAAGQELQSGQDQTREEITGQAAQAETDTAETPEQIEDYPASPEQDPAFIAATQRIAGTAGQQQATRPAEQEADAAQRAAPVAGNEREGEAQRNQVVVMDAQEPGEFNAEAFKAQLLERIKRMQLPVNQEEASNFEDHNNIQEISDAASAQASQEQASTADPIAQATNAAPDVNGVAEREVTPLPEAPIGREPRSVHANAAMPNPRPDSQVAAPLQQNMLEVDQRMADNEITEEQLANANEPGFSSALESRSTAQAHTLSTPADFRQAESDSLNSTRQQAENRSEADLSTMHDQRATALNGVLGQQVQSGTDNSSERQRIANEISTIYKSTKTDVETLLADLDEEVSSRFDSSASRARKKFEDYAEQQMDAYKDRRYSGLRGAARWIRDKFKGLPNEVNQFFVDGRQLYIDEMDTALTDISQYIAQQLTAAKSRIELGKQKVNEFVDGLDESVRNIGRQAAEDIKSKFDDLSDSVDAKQDELIDSLAQQYNDSLGEVDARIEEMKAANRGLIDQALDAINGIIETISKLKQLITDLLSEIQSVISIIMADPIGFAKNLFAGVRQGFDAFLANIQTHLIGGFVSWLTGAMGPMGITIPEDLFSLKGIFSLVGQILGLTWDYIRRKAVKLLGEQVVRTMELGLELFQLIRSRGIAGIWEYVKEQFTDLKEKVIDAIKDMLIAQVIKAGIKWLVGLLIPGAGFIKAAIAIKDFIVFFVESAMMLIPALIEAIRALASGNVSMVTRAIENGLALLLPMVINLFAKLVGLGGLVQKVQKIIARIRKRIDRAINKLILKAKKAFRKISGKVKSGAARLVKWWKARKQFRGNDGKQHALYFDGEGSSAVLTVASDPQPLRTFVTAFTPGSNAQKRQAKAQALNKMEQIDAKKRQRVRGRDESEKNHNSEKKEQEIKQLINEASVHVKELFGDNNDQIDRYIDQQALLRNQNKDFTRYGNRIKSDVELLGYGFRKQGDAYQIWRRDAATTKQVHIDDNGKLQSGGSSASQSTHSNYIPTSKTIKETEQGYLVEYDTKTDEGKPGPKFHIDISYDKALASNENKVETRTVSGTDLKLKTSGGARGRTDPAHQGFHNAHLIADRFGGSGRNRDMNIYPSSPGYNVKDMKDKEDKIARNLNPATSFNMTVTSTIEGEKADSSALKTAINEEAKRDNTLQNQKINEDMANDLLGLVRKDIKGIPGQFTSVNYAIGGRNVGQIGKDEAYTDLIKKILKK